MYKVTNSHRVIKMFETSRFGRVEIWNLIEIPHIIIIQI